MKTTTNPTRPGARPLPERRGIAVVLTGFALVAVFAFVALSVDTGRIVLTETEMQNAVDAASLAAAQEITVAVQQAGQGEGSANIDLSSAAIASARIVAEEVAAANDVFIDPVADVRFGKRRYDPDSQTWPIIWDEPPFNVVQVIARRTENDSSAPDGQFPLAFGWAVGRSQVPIQASATAFVESRDLVVVLDFSGSMNDDSSLRSNLGKEEAEELLDDMWDSLVAADPKFRGTNISKFPADGFGGIDSYQGVYLSSNSTSTVRNQLGLSQNNSDGRRRYPFPQAGRFDSGNERYRPSNSYSDSLWNDYIRYVRNRNDSYRKRYGYRTLMDYLQERRVSRTRSEDLWRTPHYPFHAVKQSASLFLDFLTELDYGDEVGLVSYATYAQKEFGHFDGEVDIDISSDPITSNYAVIDTIQRRHQAGDYASRTAMGDGILNGRELLVGDPNDSGDQGHSRFGARPTLVVMTDGRANERPSGWTTPSGFNWADHTDYDGDGVADYTTNDLNRQYAFVQAVEAAKLGITIHTLAVGAGADGPLMRAIAFAGDGIYINIPGGTTALDTESQLREAFRSIASSVPPAKLTFDLSESSN